jgi:DNA-binding Lrp family transcriptional regulator
MNGIVAYMLLVTESGKEHEIVKEIRTIGGVTETRPVYGEFDVFIRLDVSDLSSLDEIVTQVRRIPGVNQTTTLVGSP